MTRRIALYLRYSTELQSETSLVDQERYIRKFISRMGWDGSISVYSDRAISGTSRHNRPGFLSMVKAMENGHINTIAVENLSRLTRDLEDCGFLMKRAKFNRTEVHCANENGVPLTLMHAALSALMAEQARDVNAEMTKRGMVGIILDGKSAGGRSFGYRSLPRLASDKGRGGEVEIVPEEAAIIVEIFNRYVAGESPKAIAADLNRRRIASPRAALRGKNGVNTGLWSDSTINGSRARGTGVLHNMLYVGRRVWNRVQMPKHPDTARRVSRANDPSEWVSSCVDERLRIVSDELFDNAQARKEERSFKQVKRQAQRPKRLFSGLMQCGGCGLPINSAGWDKNNRLRVKCSGKTNRGICANPVGCYAEDVEAVVLNALRAQLGRPHLMQAYVDAYVEERRSLARNTVNDCDAISRRIAALNAQMDRTRKWALEGITDQADFERDYRPMVAEREALKAKAAAIEEPTAVISYQPAAIASFKKAIGSLGETLCSDGAQPSAQLIRSVVDRVIITPAKTKPSTPFERRAIVVEIVGKLDALLDMKTTAEPDFPHVGELNGSGGGAKTFVSGRFRASPSPL